MKSWATYCARAVALFMLLSSLSGMGQVAVTTYHNDNSRRGLNANETILTPANVNEVSFGKRLVLPVTGYIYGQPLYVPSVNINGTLHNVVYVATEHDQVYAFDANSGQLLWQTSFIGTFGNKQILPLSPDDVECHDISPEVGITSTPVIDLTTNEIYLVAATKEIVNGTTTFYQRMHVLDIRTGKELLLNPYFGAPIKAKTPGTGAGSIDGYLIFNPKIENQRAALALANGLVFVSWGSHCDQWNFHGYVMAFTKSSLHPSGVFVTTPNAYEGGVWGGGWGPAIDSNNFIYVTTGNGYFDANVGGIDYADTILRLSWLGPLPQVSDYFTPWDQGILGSHNMDVAAGGTLLLPDQPGAPYPHLLVQAGKEGTIDLVNRDNMGHFNPAGDTQIVQTLPYIIGDVFGGPAMWNNNLYFGSLEHQMEAFYYDPVAQQIQPNYTSATPEYFAFPSPTPSVSANGNSNGIVWIVETDAYGSGYAVLRAYDATNLATELYNSDQNRQRDRAGLSGKFSVPTIADGLVFVGALNEMDVYGLLQ
jgi:hypothetical protein